MNKILIVEDDKMLLEMYKDEFTTEHFEVQTANDGQEGIEKMKTNTPDAVLLDLIMPKVNGYEFLKLLNADPFLKKVPVLVLTNIYTNSEDLIKNWNVKTVLMKSDHTPGSIVTKVKQIIDQKAQVTSS
jgi:DNA-binding response OmpR family regulator